jgi:hypothetical protein
MSKVSPDWVAALPEDKKPTTKVPPCLGCGRLPHPDELTCLRRKIASLTALLNMNVEERAEMAYTVHAREVFGVPPKILGKPDAGKSGRHWQTAPVDWSQLPEVFRDKWRKIVKAIA